jgi:hypothetical protein
MAGLDELFNQIPTQEIASKLGVDEGEVNSAIKALVPALVGGIQQNVQAATSIRASSSPTSQHKAPAACWTAGSTSTRSMRTRATNSLRASSAATTAMQSPRHRRRRRK